MELHKLPLRELKGKKVELTKAIKTRGGHVFEAGTIMYITYKRNGFGLSLEKDGIYDIRGVRETAFRVVEESA